MPSAGASPPPSDEFSLVLGGPLFQLFRRAHLSGGHLELARRRTRFGNRLIAKREAARDILRTLRAGGTVAILVDQNVAREEAVFVPFFGRLAATPRAAADLALRFGAAVIVVTCHRRGPRARDGHRLEVEEVPVHADAEDREAEVVRLTAACTAVQERAIRRHPDEWVWMHQRWKTRPPAEAEHDGVSARAASGEGTSR